MIQTTAIYPLPNGITFRILEVRDDIVREFNHRFQVMLDVDNKKLIPKNKREFLEFEDNDYLYVLKSENNDIDVAVPAALYYEKQICDLTLEECNVQVLDYMSMYNQGANVRQELSKIYSL